jgi:hypothetical protein
VYIYVHVNIPEKSLEKSGGLETQLEIESAEMKGERIPVGQLLFSFPVGRSD